MSNIFQKLATTTTIASLVGIVFCTSSALGVTLTREEFSGDFTLVESRTFGDPFPETTNYSGFVLYDENNRLQDWAINVSELDLALNPESTETALDPDSAVTFESPPNWNLRIDFGIAADRPLYTLQRSTDGITFNLFGFGSSFTYVDSNPNIASNVVSNTSNSETSTVINTNNVASNISIPEPSSIFTLVAFLAGMPILKRYLNT